MLWLAQQNDPSKVIPIVIALVIAVLVLGGAIMFLRRKLLSREQDTVEDEGLLQGLRRMRDEGKLSQAEFDAARRKMVMKSAERLKSPAKSNKQATQSADANLLASRGELEAAAAEALLRSQQRAASLKPPAQAKPAPSDTAHPPKPHKPTS
jgi:flagellar basal body-associated protein FliL